MAEGMTAYEHNNKLWSLSKTILPIWEETNENKGSALECFDQLRVHVFGERFEEPGQQEALATARASVWRWSPACARHADRRAGGLGEYRFGAYRWENGRGIAEGIHWRPITFWSFGLVNRRLAEIFFNRNNGKVKFTGHAFVKKEDYKTKHEIKWIEEEIERVKLTCRQGKYAWVKEELGKRTKIWYEAGFERISLTNVLK